MAFYCYEGSRKQINRENYYRNLPSNDLQMVFSPRGVQTRHVKMPIVDCRKPSKYAIKKEPMYEPQKMFNPSNVAPYAGYANNVDEESSLYNIVFPTQPGIQSKWVPNSDSDMYKDKISNSRPVEMNHPGLFRREQFLPRNSDPCNLGYKVFNNHTKYEVKGLDQNK